MFGYLEEYFSVTARMASSIIVSLLVGEFFFPLIISYYITTDPMIFQWVTLFCSLCLGITFLAGMFVIKTKLKKRELNDE